MESQESGVRSQGLEVRRQEAEGRSVGVENRASASPSAYCLLSSDSLSDLSFHESGRPFDGPRCVPGTCVGSARVSPPSGSSPEFPTRDPKSRNLYAHKALAAVPRLLGAIDRNRLSPTYGCMDRQYWHYRTACFPSEMYQEGVLPLAYAATLNLPDNRWFGSERAAELAEAGIRFAARHDHADGSCDDYYPFERAFGAAVFSAAACTEAYRILGLDDPELVDWFRRRAAWLTKNGESGRLTNHHALAALALARTYEITGELRHKTAAEAAVGRVLDWQHEEGWFEEYGGADPGYQTVTIDCLAKLRKMWNTAELDEPLRRAVRFARCFLHPDGSYGGEYGSRGTYHFYPHGFELLAGTDPDASELADAFMQTLADGSEADFSDDRLFAHRLGNLFEAYRDWSPARPSARLAEETRPSRHFPAAGLVVCRRDAQCTVISTARGGVFKHFADGRPAAADAGLILETDAGRIAVSQMYASPSDESDAPDAEGRRVEVQFDGEVLVSVAVEGPLHWTRFETATPFKQAALHLGMAWIGRYCRTLVRKALQKRLITGRRPAPIRLTRTFTFETPPETGRSPQGLVLEVIDVIELTDPRIRVRRMALGSDHQTGYTAASGVFHPSVMTPWVDLNDRVEILNKARRIEIVRRFS